MYDKFFIFRKTNPFEFEEEEFQKIENDIQNPRDGVVCDEYVDFILWTKGLKSRQDSFAEYVELLFSPNKYHNLLEVGAGRVPRLSNILVKKGYHMTAMDPKLDVEKGTADEVNRIAEAFVYSKTNVTKYDAVVAQEPCEATEHIVRECVAKQKDFIISLCGVPHVLMNGEMPEDAYTWYNYLAEIDKEHCILLKPNLIPGYVSYVLAGKFGV